MARVSFSDLQVLKLSIIVPALNEAGAIEAALRPLQAWRSATGTTGTSAAKVEIIVADGGSSDATMKLARPLADQVICAPRGRARQMNAGAAASSGDALLFLHADTILPEAAPRAILEALSLMDPHPPTLSGRPPLAGKCWGRFDVVICGAPAMLGVIAWCMNRRSRLTGIATGDQALFMTRAAFDAAGGFPDQPLMEDIAMCKRLKRQSAPACLMAKVITSGRRWEQRGVWRTIWLMWRLRLAYFLGTSPEYLVARYR